MARPGPDFIVRATPAARSTPTNTGRWFVAQLFEKGPTDPTSITSPDQLRTVFGGKVSYSTAPDALETFFAEGGSEAIVSRVLGATPVKAGLNLAGAGGTTLRAEATSEGEWGNSLKLEIVNGPAGASTRVVNVYDSSTGVDVLLEACQEQSTQQGLIDAFAASASIRLVDDVADAGLPNVIAKTALSGGTDDRATALDAQFKAALDRFVPELGPGQVSMPGRTTTQAHTDLLEHAKANNRHALLDLPDVAQSGKTTLKTATTTLRALDASQYGSAWTPWLKIAGTAVGTTRDVPPSALVAGLIARSDAVNSPNVAAAGENGIARYVRSVKTPWTAAEMEELSIPEKTFAAHGSINVIRVVDGVIMAYGNRTLVDPATRKLYLQLSNVRLDMAIATVLRALAGGFVFREINAATIAGFHVALTGAMNRYYTAGSLYGDSAEEAFSVETGAQVNTPTTAAAGELLADVAYHRTPGAEAVVTRVARVPVDQPLAA